MNSMYEFMKKLLEEFFNTQMHLVSLGNNTLICNENAICQTAFDWFMSIIAIGNSNSEVYQCIKKTSQREEKVLKTAFLQYNHTTCWAATAVMLAQFHDLTKYKDEKKFLESKCPKILRERALKVVQHFRENRETSIRNLSPRDEFRTVINIKCIVPLKEIENKLKGSHEKYLSLEDFWYIAEFIFPLTQVPENSDETQKNIATILLTTQKGIIKDMFDGNESNMLNKVWWFRFNVEAFYCPKTQNSATQNTPNCSGTLRAGLNDALIEKWFKVLMEFHVDFFNSNNQGHNFTLKYFVNRLLSSPVIISMPSEIIKEPDNLYSHIVANRISANVTHYVMFYGMTIQNGEIVCKYVETIYFDYQDNLIVEEENKKNKPKLQPRTNFISWKTLEKWMKSPLNINKVVIYK